MMTWIMTTNVKVTPIMVEQYFRNQLSKDRKRDTLEDIIRQFENQMQQDKVWTHTKVRNETTQDDIKDSTQQNHEQDTTNGCTVNPHKTLTVTSNTENGANSESPKYVDNKTNAKQMNTITEIECDMEEW